MTTLQILLMEAAYLIFFAAVVYLTRPSLRRITGSLAGGAASGLVALSMISIAEANGWWSIPSRSAQYFWPQLFAGFAISMAPTFLIIWRISRRFAWRGLAIFLGAVALIGPPRDYMIASFFPEWMVFSPGFVPVLADEATYIGMVVVGYSVMRLVAGPDDRDFLASRK
jgi:hypothetical protein